MTLEIEWTCPCQSAPLVPIADSGKIRCSVCGTEFPVLNGVPYIASYGTFWRAKLRELLTFHDYWHKIRESRLEPDRFAGKVDEARQTFGNIAGQFWKSMESIDFSKHPRILDVGAGVGEVSQALAERGAEVWAIDLNYLDLHLNPRWMTLVPPPEPFDYYSVWRGKAFEPKFHRAIADGDHIPLPDGSMDIVLLRAVAHHVLDLPWFFAEANRVLKLGGRIMLVGEPIASVLDRNEEYLRDDTDWQEGMTEQRPTYWAYARGLRGAGFGRLEAVPFAASLGFRFGRRLARFGRSPLLPWLNHRRLRGWATYILSFVGAGVDMAATKLSEVPRKSFPKPVDTPALPFGDLLAAMAKDVEVGRRTLREHLAPGEALTQWNASTPIPRDSIRGFRDPEWIDGRMGRYLLTEAVLTLQGWRGESHRNEVILTCHGNRCQALGGEPEIYVNDRLVQSVPVPQAWGTLVIPLQPGDGPAIDLRIRQPRLATATPPEDWTDRRSVALALEKVEVL